MKDINIEAAKKLATLYENVTKQELRESTAEKLFKEGGCVLCEDDYRLAKRLQKVAICESCIYNYNKTFQSLQCIRAELRDTYVRIYSPTNSVKDVVKACRERAKIIRNIIKEIEEKKS